MADFVLVVGAGFDPPAGGYEPNESHLIKTKKPLINQGLFLFSSGGWIRTNDFWVMSPTSYLCSTPQYGFNNAKIHYFWAGTVNDAIFINTI